MGKIEIFKGQNGQYYFRVVAENGQTVASSEGYVSKQGCEDGIKSVKENINSNIVDLTLNNKPIVNQEYTLDLGSTPVRVRVEAVDEKYVYVEYLTSWPERREKFSLDSWNQFA